MKPLTMRQRILAVIKGESLDRVPFVQYYELPPQPKILWDYVGRDNVGLLRWTLIHRLEHPNCKIVTEDIARDDLKGLRTVVTTPSGTVTEEKYFEPTFGTASIEKHFVTDKDDYVILAEFLEDGIVVKDFSEFYLHDQQLGDDGLPLVYLHRTPWQQLWIQWVSIEDLCLHAIDCPELLDRCIGAMLRQEQEIFKIAADSPAQWFDIGDNITAPLVGVENFKKYCVPSYNRLAEMLAPKKLPVIVHMDGDLKPLWEAIGESKVGGLDSFSPPPDNDTPVAKALDMWPDKRLFLNFPSSVHLADEQTIYETAMNILEAGGHSGRLQIQVSENVPPDIWRKSYPQIIRAINDFGKP